MRNKALLCLLFLTFLLPAWACRSQEKAAAGRHGGTLRYALEREPASFNPALAVDVRTKLFAKLTAATLVETDQRDFSVRPALASAWKRQQDGKTLLVALRKDIRFSDGAPLTSDDVVFTFNAITDEKSGSPYRDTLRFAGQPVTCEKVDDHSVRLTFAAGLPVGIEATLSEVPILPKRRLQPKMTAPLGELWTLSTPPSEMAGLGPFVIEQHLPGQKTVLARNPHYWKSGDAGGRLPYLDRIEIGYVPDRNTQLLRFQSGELDLLDQYLRPEDFKTLREQPDRYHVENVGPGLQLDLMWLNLNDPATTPSRLDRAKRAWFQNEDFRRALAHAIDRQAIVDNVYGGLATITFGLVPASLKNWHSAAAPSYAHDPNRALELLRSAGFTLKESSGQKTLLDPRGQPVRFALALRTGNAISQGIGTLIQEDMARIGIQTQVDPQDFVTLISKIQNSFDYEAIFFSMTIPLDPSEMGNVLRSDAMMHPWAPRQKKPATEWEARIDQMMDRISIEASPTERRKLFDEVQTILGQRSPIIPLVTRNVLLAARKNLKGLRPAITNPPSLWNSWELHFE
ncbi:MAG: ABC transporter substrate-binding protein [Acidobacteriota bacterium]